MPRSRVVMPETTVLHISDGDTLTVKKRLNAGESRQQLARMYRQHNGTRVLDTLQVGMSTVLAYLLDWSLVDPSGNQIVIRDQPEDAVISALDSLDPESFKEIREAIEAHERAMDAERAAKKKIPTGEPRSEAISASPSDATGGTNGSPNSTEMSTAN
jgi:hypothetical protein